MNGFDQWKATIPTPPPAPTITRHGTGLIVVPEVRFEVMPAHLDRLADASARMGTRADAAAVMAAELAAMEKAVADAQARYKEAVAAAVGPSLDRYIAASLRREVLTAMATE